MSRELREQRAKEILAKQPELGIKKLNIILKEEFGVGIRSSDLAKLKNQITESNILVKREKQLIRDGFLPSEARQLAIKPISDPRMLRYRTERIHTRMELDRAGLAKKQQNQQIKADMIIEGYGIGKGKKAKINALKRFDDYLSALAPSEARAIEKIDLTGTRRDIYNKWRESGFTDFEAKELTVGKEGINVNSVAVYESEAGRKARRDRRIYIDSLLKRGWGKDEIRKAIETFYGNRKSSVWDFIRKDYQPKGKTSHSNDYIEAVRAKSSEITAHLYRRRK